MDDQNDEKDKQRLTDEEQALFNRALTEAASKLRERVALIAEKCGPNAMPEEMAATLVPALQAIRRERGKHVRVIAQGREDDLKVEILAAYEELLAATDACIAAIETRIPSTVHVGPGGDA